MAGLLSTLQHRLDDPSIPWKTVVAVSVLAGELFEGYVGCVAGSQTLDVGHARGDCKS